MEPWDFAAKWVPKRRFGLQPGDHGFKKQAAQEIHRALEGLISVSTITQNWGKDLSARPSWVPFALGLVDRLREVEALGRKVTGLGIPPMDDEDP